MSKDALLYKQGQDRYLKKHLCFREAGFKPVLADSVSLCEDEPNLLDNLTKLLNALHICPFIQNVFILQFQGIH